MDALDLLLTRRTVRVFEPVPVPAADVERLLRVLMQSPSASDARPWQFVVVDRRGLLDELEAAMPHCEMLKTAPLGLLVCAEPAREKIPGFWPQDCAAAAENLLIAAHALGYGACWIGLHPVADREAAVRRVLGLPDGLVPFALVALGHPAEFPGREDRYDPSRVHRNGW